MSDDLDRLDRELEQIEKELDRREAARMPSNELRREYNIKLSEILRRGAARPERITIYERFATIAAEAYVERLKQEAAKKA
jgi:hypothetical protein